MKVATVLLASLFILGACGNKGEDKPAPPAATGPQVGDPCVFTDNKGIKMDGVIIADPAAGTQCHPKDTTT